MCVCNEDSGQTASSCSLAGACLWISLRPFVPCAIGEDPDLGYARSQADLGPCWSHAALALCSPIAAHFHR